MRQCDVFLQKRGCLLRDLGYESDQGQLEQTASSIIFYHYTNQERLDEIWSSGGLWARLRVLPSELTPEFVNYYLIEGILEPLPKWFCDGPYFGDLPLEMMREYVGDYLLRIEVPLDFPGLYVVDHAHPFECKHFNRRGSYALHLGYDCRTGHEVVRAFTHSYIPVSEYNGGHIAPGVQTIRKGEGIAIPKKFISESEYQPLQE